MSHLLLLERVQSALATAETGDNLVQVATAAHKAELLASAYEREFPTCEEHRPTGAGSRGTCLICAGQAMQLALSRISYLCGEPNEYELSDFDIHYNPKLVIEQVRAKLASASQQGSKDE